MLLLFVFALLAVLQAAVYGSTNSISVALAALAAAVASELFATHREHGLRRVTDGSAAACALVLVLMLPAEIHPMHAALGAVFATAVAKHSFGGPGSNTLNPALCGWLFVRFSWPGDFSAAADLAGAALAPGGTAGSSADQGIRDFLNGTVFAPFGARLPPGYIDVFISGGSGVMADRAVLSLFLFASAMFAFRAGRWRVSVAYLAVFAFLSRLLGDIPGGGGLWKGDAVMGIFSGGTLLTAFVLLAYPSGGSRSSGGIVVMAVLAAVLAAVFRYIGGEFYGGFFAAVAVNAIGLLLVPLERRVLYASYTEAQPSGERSSSGIPAGVSASTSEGGTV
jgi:electron transport complex protein RnfD